MKKIVMVFILFGMCFTSCKKEDPCTDDNTGTLLVINNTNITWTIRVDSHDEGTAAPHSEWSKALSIGSHTVAAVHGGSVAFTPPVTIEQCKTDTLTLQ